MSFQEKNLHCSLRKETVTLVELLHHIFRKESLSGRRWWGTAGVNHFFKKAIATTCD